MRTALVRAATIALGVILMVACTDEHRDLLAPHAGPEKIVVINRCGDLILCNQPNWIDISAGAGVTCAVHSVSPFINIQITTSNLSCWGSNYYGMLGVGTTTESCVGYLNGTNQTVACSTTPKPVAVAKVFNSVSVGSTHVCAIERGTALAFCWGSNASGALGFGNHGVGNFPTPTSAAAGGLTFNSIAAGNGQTCGVTTAQDIVCWGGSFGDAPVLKSNGTDKFQSVTLELDMSAASVVCGLTTAGTSCNGSHTPYSLLGQGTTANHFCQITSGTVECWGSNSSGQLGTSSSKFMSSSSPVSVTASVAVQSVATGELHSCAISGTDAFCWGHGWDGELGNETQNSFAAPTQVESPFGTTLSFTKISTGAEHTCAIANNSLWCWGRNESGQLGVGTNQTFLTYPLPPTGKPVMGLAVPAKVSGT